MRNEYALGTARIGFPGVSTGRQVRFRRLGRRISLGEMSTLFGGHWSPQYSGVVTTSGREKIAAATHGEKQASFGRAQPCPQVLPALGGEVRLAVTEGLGTFWLIPRLVEFQRAFPRLLVDVQCSMQTMDMQRREVDVAVQLIRPTVPHVEFVKLGRLHSMCFAAPSYIETSGAPSTVEELRRHRIVTHVAEQTAMNEVYNRIFPGVPQAGFVTVRTDLASSNYWAIARGAGIGWLPTYAHAIGARVVPLELDLRFQIDIWLTYHPDAGRSGHVRRIIDWLIESFDPQQFPWFRDEFIHPNDLPREYRGAPLINWFEGFTGR